jgi:uncharacterized RDD family membrane protein YckC
VGALFVDWAIAWATTVLIGGTTYGDASQDLPFWAPILVFFLEVGIVTAFLGMSIGKRIFGIRVAGYDGGPIGPRGAFIRTALLCLVVPALLVTHRQRGLHDVAAGSIVVKA